MVGGTVIGDVAYVEADSCGGSASWPSAGFSPAGSVGGTGGEASAEVVAGPEAHARAQVATLNVSLAGLTIVGANIDARADATAAGTTASGSGSITINGVNYLNPAAGLVVSAAGYRIVLNDQRREADGSISITYLRVEGSGTQLTAAWAFVKPVGDLCA
jgi:hypothetical protein